MKRQFRKLVLNKETIRALNQPELARVNGGFETAYEDEQTRCIPGTNTCPGGCGGSGYACGTFGCPTGYGDCTAGVGSCNGC